MVVDFDIGILNRIIEQMDQHIDYNLLKQGGNEAATAVGYESTTQFSREFKRYFGDSPVNYTGRDNSSII